jgi:hypothetical protein
MKNDQQLGLDELMIVNPSSSGAEAMFLGEDGTVYQVQGLGKENTQQGMGQYFLGEDGTLYQVQGFDEDSSAKSIGDSGQNLGEVDGRVLGRYFLGEDGALYEVIQ